MYPALFGPLQDAVVIDHTDVMLLRCGKTINLSDFGHYQKEAGRLGPIRPLNISRNTYNNLRSHGVNISFTLLKGKYGHSHKYDKVHACNVSTPTEASLDYLLQSFLPSEQYGLFRHYRDDLLKLKEFIRGAIPTPAYIFPPSFSYDGCPRSPIIWFALADEFGLDLDRRNDHLCVFEPSSRDATAEGHGDLHQGEWKIRASFNLGTTNYDDKALLCAVGWWIGEILSSVPTLKPLIHHEEYRSTSRMHRECLAVTGWGTTGTLGFRCF